MLTVEDSNQPKVHVVTFSDIPFHGLFRRERYPRELFMRLYCGILQIYDGDGDEEECVYEEREYREFSPNFDRVVRILDKSVTLTSRND